MSTEPLRTPCNYSLAVTLAVVEHVTACHVIGYCRQACDKQRQREIVHQALSEKVIAFIKHARMLRLTGQAGLSRVLLLHSLQR
jgi:hypothetical protein